MTKQVTLTEVVEGCAVDFEKLAKSHRAVTFEAECKFALQILKSNEYLEKTARGNPDSLKQAIENVAAIGISLNPASKHAYLIPRYVNRKTVVCLDVSYMGMVHLAISSGNIEWVQARLVHETDHFRFLGMGNMPEHTFDPFAKDRGETTGAYCVAKTSGGDYLIETMSTEAINDIRNRSESYKAYANGKVKTSPWVSDWGEMAKKTVVKRAAKLWPKIKRLDEAINEVNKHEGIDFEKENYISATTPDDIAAMGEERERQERLGVPENVDPAEVVITYGRYNGKRYREIARDDLLEYYDKLEEKHGRDGGGSYSRQCFMRDCEKYLEEGE